MAQVAIDREKFASLMGLIIANEFNQKQKEMFVIEGDDLIDKLFSLRYLESEESNKLLYGKMFGLTEFEEAAKLSIDFLSLIVACFSGYLSYTKNKFDRQKEQNAKNTELMPDINAPQKKLELLKELRDEMIYQKMPEEVIAQITDKYQKELMDLIPEL